MKPAFLGIILGVAIAALAVGSSCSVTHRSGDYACTSTKDCTGSRVCDNGFCIVPGSIDAPGPPKDSGSGSNGCPTGCSSCNVTQKQCTIDCRSSSCNGQVTCPTGYHCDIKCDVDGSCRNGVNCQTASSCTVECTAGNACQNVQCGLGPCDVMCTGQGSCRGVSCNQSCACDVICNSGADCSNVQCTSPTCINGSGCSSVIAFCHSC